jgi:glycosyltransferase involved in cell wall biosynthesis
MKVDGPDADCVSGARLAEQSLPTSRSEFAVEVREIRKIAIVMVRYLLGISTSIIHIAKVLAREGIGVDILIDEGLFLAAPIEFAERLINVIVLPSAKLEKTRGARSTAVADAKRLLRRTKILNLLRRLKRSSWQAKYWVLRHVRPNYGPGEFAKMYYPYLWAYADVLKSKVAEERYFAVVGVEPLGLLLSYLALDSMGGEAPHLVYLNLELLQHENSMTVKDHLLKDAEITCSRRADFTIIPDAKRGRVFAKENGIDEARLRYLTVSACGDAVRTKGNYLRELFDIPPEMRIALYTGNIVETMMCREVVESVDRWPGDCVLVLHTWRRDIESSPYYRELVKIADAARVYFSTEPVAYERLPELLSSADIGLMFYKPINANFSEVGSSSNKIAQYVQVGLPVIANNLPSIGRIFDKYGNGICVDDPGDMGNAIREVFEHYEEMREGAFRCFKEHYNFTRAFEPLLREFKEMAGGKA